VRCHGPCTWVCRIYLPWYVAGPILLICWACLSDVAPKKPKYAPVHQLSGQNCVHQLQHLVVCLQHANASSVISLQYPNQEDCTILISKSASKYRLQGSSYQALWLPLVELVQRLKAYFAGIPVCVQLEENLPVAWYHGCIDSYFSARKLRRAVLSDLEQAAGQVCINVCKQLLHASARSQHEPHACLCGLRRAESPRVHRSGAETKRGPRKYQNDRKWKKCLAKPMHPHK
jgi:hypothetical protein